MGKSLFKTEVKKIDGTTTTLADYEGRVLLVVNVASKCGLTPQYDALEKLYERFKARGFEVLGFPSNEFAGQEPGTNEEIAQFCEMKFGIKFPMFEKISVKLGPDQHPLYTQMIQAQPAAVKTADNKLAQSLAGHGLAPKSENDVMWNFEKFLINRRGEVVGRFAPDITPDDPKLVKAIEAQL
jgi:glutathione peroxidase